MGNCIVRFCQMEFVSKIVSWSWSFGERKRSIKINAPLCSECPNSWAIWSCHTNLRVSAIWMPESSVFKRHGQHNGPLWQQCSSCVFSVSGHLSSTNRWQCQQTFQVHSRLTLWESPDQSAWNNSSCALARLDQFFVQRILTLLDIYASLQARPCWHRPLHRIYAMKSETVEGLDLEMPIRWHYDEVIQALSGKHCASFGCFFLKNLIHR